MKTTVEIPDRLFRRAKNYCAERGVPLRALIEEGLRRVLESPPAPPAFRLRPFGFRGRGWTALPDWRKVREMIYEGRGGRPARGRGGGGASSAVRMRLEEVSGCLRYSGNPKTLAEMEQAVAREARKRQARGRY